MYLLTKRRRLSRSLSVRSANVTLVFLLSFSFVLSAFCADSASKKFAVETIQGVPMITIDGTPVRSRMFFGLNGSRPIISSTEFQSYEFEFVASDDAQGDGTIHFRFGTEPGVVVIDNVSIVDKESQQAVAGPYDFEQDADLKDHWETWHSVFQGRQIGSVAAQDGVGRDGSRGLVVKLNEFPKDWSPDFHLFHKRELTIHRGKTYVVRFDLRSDVERRLHVNIYRPGNPYIRLGNCGSNVFESQVQLAGQADVNFVTFNPMVEVWPRDDGSYDWTQMEAMCDAALRANPNALLIPRFRLNASKSWLERHPNARAVWQSAGKDSDGQGWDWASPASPEYRQTACEALAATIRRLESKYGDSIAGYHPAGQNTSEWFIPNTWGSGYAGFSVSDRDAFREWLRNKYSTDQALQQAWNDATVTLSTANVPSVEERDASRAQPFVQSPKLLDFNQYWQSAMTDVILQLADTIKRETNGRKLSVFFYGYSYEFSSVGKGPAASAHYALRNLLDSPNVDIICSPISYSDRGLGGGCCCMLNAETVMRAGKLYLYEDDSRTFIAHATGSRLSSVETLEDSINILLRNSGECALRNFGTWLMDLGAAGWYDSPELWQASASLAELDRYFLDNPTPYEPEIGVFLSDRSMLKISDGKFSSPGVYLLRTTLGRLGAPYAQYELDDLLLERVKCPKFCIVLNSDALSKEEKDTIERQAQKSQATVLFLGLNGIELEALRAEALKAGVWIYTQEYCNVWANGPFVLLHAPKDGEYHFQAPNGAKQIVDYFSGKELSNDGKVTFNLKLGDTKIVKIK